MFAARNAFMAGGVPRGTNVTYVSTALTSIGTHKPGDLIVCIASHIGTTVPTAPSAGGTVPVWNTIFSNKPSLAYGFKAAWAIATADNHTLGTWSDSFDQATIVFRNTSTSAPIGAYGDAGGNSSVMNFPAITLNNTSGSGQIFQCAFQGVGSLTSSTADSGYTTRLAGYNWYFSTKNSTTADGLNYTNSSGTGYYYTIQMEIKW